MFARKTFLISVVLLLFIQSAFGQTPSAVSSKLPEADHLNVDGVDTSIDPCTNFYEYSCKKWIAANPIPMSVPMAKPRSASNQVNSAAITR